MWLFNKKKKKDVVKEKDCDDGVRSAISIVKGSRRYNTPEEVRLKANIAAELVKMFGIDTEWHKSDIRTAQELLDLQECSMSLRVIHYILEDDNVIIRVDDYNDIDYERVLFVIGYTVKEHLYMPKTPCKFPEPPVEVHYLLSDVVIPIDIGKIRISEATKKIRDII